MTKSNIVRVLTGAAILGFTSGLTWAQVADAPSAPQPVGAPGITEGIAQDSTSSTEGDPGQADERGGWRRLGQEGSRNRDGTGIEDDRRYRPPARRPMGPPPNLPAQLTVPSGTFVTIRVNQALSSDHSRPGEPFSASLVKPIVVDGIVVADRGQTLAGRVADASKAGRIKGVSRLGIELTEVSLVDGTQVPLRSQLITYEGPGSVGRDATAIGTTTALGALVGAAAQGGAAAGIGAGAGAGAALIGVLLTRGRPTMIYPESVLTFRVETPIVISTYRAPQAFRTVGPGDYNQPSDQPRTLVQRQAAPPSFGGWGGWGPGWGYPGWGYPGWYGPGYFGPTVGIGFYRGFGGRGFGRRGWR